MEVSWIGNDCEERITTGITGIGLVYSDGIHKRLWSQRVTRCCGDRVWNVDGREIYTDIEIDVYRDGRE